MTCLHDGLEYFLNLIGSEISQDALMVDKDTHWLIIQLTKTFGLQVDFGMLCAPDRYADACHP
jgi:hypothetical protein